MKALEENLEGVMTVAACREVNNKCSADLHSRITTIKIDLALIKKHLGINGQYVVKPPPMFHNRRATDAPGEDHVHVREHDVVIEHKQDTISFPTPPKWMVMLAVGIFLLAGAGLLLIIQTKTDLEQIKKFQTLNNKVAVDGQKEIIGELGADHEHIIRKLKP